MTNKTIAILVAYNKEVYDKYDDYVRSSIVVEKITEWIDVTTEQHKQLEWFINSDYAKKSLQSRGYSPEHHYIVIEQIKKEVIPFIAKEIIKEIEIAKKKEEERIKKAEEAKAQKKILKEAKTKEEKKKILEQLKKELGES